MGHITQCPQCSTRFRVVADQLKISDGWVRCGRCGEVFDAAACMVAEESVPPSPVAPVPVEPIPTASEPSLSEATFFAPLPADPHASPPGGTEDSTPEVDILLDGDTWAAPPPGPLLAAEALLQSDEVRAEAAPLSVDAEPSDGADTSRVASHEVPSSGADALPATPEELAVPAAQVSDGGAAAVPVPVPEVSFVRQARRRAFWGRPAVRALLGLLALVLGVLLVAQVTLHERDRVATMFPAIKPWLEAACEPLGCEVGLLRQIDSLVIDSSALVRVRGGLYRFETNLKNTSDLVLAPPALELSLTNQRDEVVLRRVILPGDWTTALVDLPAHADVTLSVPLTFSNPDELRMSGYRATVFYP